MMAHDQETHRRRSIRLRGYDYAQTGAYFVTICTQDRACLFGEVVDGEMRLNDAGRMIATWWTALNGKFPCVQTDVSIVMPNHFHGIIVITNPVGADPRVCPDTNAGAQTGAGLGAHIGAPLPIRPDTNAGAQTGAVTGAHIGAPLPIPADTNAGAQTGAGLGAHIGAPLPIRPDTNVGARMGAVTGAHIGAPLPIPADTNAGAQTGAGLGAHIGAPLPIRPDTNAGAQTGAGLGAHTGAPLPEIVQWFKTMTTNEHMRRVKNDGWLPFRGRLWQRNYYEHIIRNEESLNRIRQYVLDNPVRWAFDRENPEAAAPEPDDAWAE